MAGLDVEFKGDYSHELAKKWLIFDPGHASIKRTVKDRHWVSPKVSPRTNGDILEEF